MQKIIFSIWIYVGWFGCIYFGKMSWGIASFIFPIVSWVLMYRLFKPRFQMIAQLLILCGVGLIFDSIAVHYNLIQMSTPAEIGWLPLWLISMWFLFVCSLPLLQSLFRKKYFLAAILGAVFGPLSYKAGAQFEVLTMTSTMSFIIYSLFWAVYMPVGIYLSGRSSRL